MKRYEQRGHSYLELTNDGPLVEHEEVRASIERLLAVAEGLEHESGCYSHKHCGVAGCNHPPWAGFHHMQKPTYMHEFEPGKCTCRISELRRGLEVMIK